MKRWVLVSSFLLFIALCASVAYWSMQLFRPVVRQVAAPQQAQVAAVNLNAAASLFGGRPASVAVASNYQLKGVVVAGNAIESVAILSADGKPALAVGVNREVSPGVTVREVHGQYVLLNEGGVTKRVELPEGVKPQLGRVENSVGGVAMPPPIMQQTAPLMPPTVVNPQAMGIPPNIGTAAPMNQLSPGEAPIQPPQGDMPPPSAVGQPNIGGAPVIQRQQ